MSPHELRKALKTLGLTNVAAGEYLGVTDKTIRRWLSGQNKIPRSAAMLLSATILGKVPHVPTGKEIRQ